MKFRGSPVQPVQRLFRLRDSTGVRSWVRLFFQANLYRRKAAKEGGACLYGILHFGVQGKRMAQQCCCMGALLIL